MKVSFSSPLLRREISIVENYLTKRVWLLYKAGPKRNAAVRQQRGREGNGQVVLSSWGLKRPWLLTGIRPEFTSPVNSPIYIPYTGIHLSLSPQCVCTCFVYNPTAPFNFYKTNKKDSGQMIIQSLTFPNNIKFGQVGLANF